MINEECESILGHLMFHRSIIVDDDDAKRERLESYVRMVEQMRQGVHLISDDPFERSVSMAFELVIQNKLNPWDIDLLEFSKMYLGRVRRRDDINLIVAGKLIHMAWEIFRLQTEDLLTRADEPERVENLFEDWDTDAIEMFSEIDDPSPAFAIMHGGLDLTEAVRRPAEQRNVSLFELLDAFEEAKREVDVRQEISRYLERYRHREFNDKSHKESLEQDIEEAWRRMVRLGSGPIALSDLYRGDKEDRVGVILAVLFLANMEKISLWQERPPEGEVFVEICNPVETASLHESDPAAHAERRSDDVADDSTVMR